MMVTTVLSCVTDNDCLATGLADQCCATFKYTNNGVTIEANDCIATSVLASAGTGYVY